MDSLMVALTDGIAAALMENELVGSKDHLLADE